MICTLCNGPFPAVQNDKTEESFTFIQIGCDPPELDEVMLLELQSKADVVKVVEGVDGRLETVVVLFLKSKKVEFNFPPFPLESNSIYLLAHLDEKAI